MPRAAASVEVYAPAEVVMGVITDLASYPEFLPHLTTVRPTPLGDGAWDVRFELHFIREIAYTLKVWRESPTCVRWSMVEGVFRSNDGAWQITELAPGALTRVDWSVDLQLEVFVPGSLIRTLADEELPGMLSRFKERAESMWRGPTIDEADDRAVAEE